MYGRNLLALAAPDPAGVGSGGRDGDTAIARDAIDNSVCYDHGLGAWVPIDDAEDAARQVSRLERARG